MSKKLREKLKVNINFAKLNTITRRKKAAIIQNEMELILKSVEFRDNLINLLDASDYQNGELSKWGDATPEEIYTHIMRGQEILSPELDNEIDIIVDDYYSLKSVIGYTYPNDPQQYTNVRFFDVRTSKANGSNFFHEYGHKLGFKHDFRRTKRRKFSLCYLMNIAYEQTHDMLFQGTTSPSDAVLVCTRPWYFLKLVRKCHWVRG